jgi:hypothetical protein
LFLLTGLHKGNAGAKLAHTAGALILFEIAAFRWIRAVGQRYQF